MYLNIITPCTRPNNLHKIFNSINIPEINFKWVIVFDADKIPEVNFNLPSNCEMYSHKDAKSVTGNCQRQFAKTFVKHGHIYYHDDDTTLHPNLWNNIKDLSDRDFISFKQEYCDGELRLTGETIKVGSIDPHNFIVDSKLALAYDWISDVCSADGIHAEQCYSIAKAPIYIPLVLSTYNKLRPNKQEKRKRAKNKKQLTTI